MSKNLPSKFFNWTVRKSTGVALHDFNCGLKAYRRAVIEQVKVYGELIATCRCWRAISASRWPK